MLKSVVKLNGNNGGEALQSLSSILHSLRRRHILCSACSYSSNSTKQEEEQPSSSSSSLPEFLVETLGFSQQQSLSTSARLALFWRSRGGQKKVSEFNFAENADSVAIFLKQIGLHDSQIRKVVCYDPRLLSCNVNKTLKPKIKVLQELGLSGSDLAHLIVLNPLLLMRSSYRTIQALRAILGSDDHVVTVFKRQTWSNLTRGGAYLIPNVELVTSYGVPRDKIQHRILQHPGPFLAKTETCRKILNRVEEKLGIPRGCNMFLYGFYLLSCITEKSIESKYRVLESFGWEESEVLSLMRRSPYSFTASEARLKKSLGFLMNELGYKPAFLVAHPGLLSYSLEKRLFPRNTVLQVLKEKGLFKLNYSLYSVACMTEREFLQKCIHPFKDILPDLHQLYANSKEYHSEPRTKQKEMP